MWLILGLDCACSPFWSYLYWVSSSFCMGGALYGLLSSVFITVYGNGMALRGPIGSLVGVIRHFIFLSLVIVV
jgi:hypothetical protein